MSGTQTIAIEGGKAYIISSESPDYFKAKYGTANPGIVIEGKVNEVLGGDWMVEACRGNIGCQLFMKRITADQIGNNEVYYGKVKGMGELVHAGELNEKIGN